MKDIGPMDEDLFSFGEDLDCLFAPFDSDTRFDTSAMQLCTTSMVEHMTDLGFTREDG